MEQDRSEALAGHECTFLGARFRLPEERQEGEWTQVRNHDLEELWEVGSWPHTGVAHSTRLTIVLEAVEDAAAPGAKVLDVGCAQGTLAGCLAHRGFRVTGLDTRAQYVDYARKRTLETGASFVCADVRLLGDENVYDVVVATELIEHVQAPGRLLNALAGRLCPGGLLLLTTPNASYFRSKLASYGSASEQTLKSLEDASADGDSHRYLFTAGELRVLLRAQGFEVVSAGWMLPFWLEGHLKLRYLYKGFRKERVRRQLLRLPVKTAYRRLAPFFASQWVVARKISIGTEDRSGGAA